MNKQEFTADDLAAATAAALELRGAPQPLIIEFPPFDAYLLVGLLQLVLKHPQLPLETRAYAVGLVETLRMFFQAMDCNEVVRQIDMGPRS
jgi:hypothetical protein